jgi:hypothetical protein
MTVFLRSQDMSTAADTDPRLSLLNIHAQIRAAVAGPIGFIRAPHTCSAGIIQVIDIVMIIPTGQKMAKVKDLLQRRGFRSPPGRLSTTLSTARVDKDENFRRPEHLRQDSDVNCQQSDASC